LGVLKEQFAPEILALVTANQIEDVVVLAAECLQFFVSGSLCEGFVFSVQRTIWSIID